MKRIFLFGANGYIGKKILDYLSLWRHLEKKQLIIIPSVVYNNHSTLLLDYFKNYRPDFVINAVGYTGYPNVSDCENNKDICYKLNVLFPRKISEICNKFKTKLIHISSGCIFNGYKKIYNEQDTPNFIGSYYSRTKKLAEQEISFCSDNNYILRIRMPFDLMIHEHKNYLRKILSYPKLINYPNSITFIDTLLETISMIISDTEIPYGIYHVTNPGIITPKEIIAIANDRNYQIPEKQYFHSLEEFNTEVFVPRSNVILDSEKGNKIFNFCNVFEAVESCL